MTNEPVCVQDVEKLYAGMGVGELEHLRAAFEADRAQPGSSSLTVEFCDNRLALIAAELVRRQPATRP